MLAAGAAGGIEEICRDSRAAWLIRLFRADGYFKKRDIGCAAPLFESIGVMTSGLRNVLSQGRTWLWGGPAIVWLLFCFWYTNTEGPLSDDEIEAFAALAERGGSSPERVQWLRRFMIEDSGDQFLMVNLLDLTDADPSRELSPEESMARYLAHMFPELFKRACHPVLSGPVVFEAMDLAGIEGAESWSSAGVVRYRSRRDLLEIALNPIFDGKHGYKIAALEKTIAVPVEPDIHLGDFRLIAFFGLFFLVVVADALIFRRRARRTAHRKEA